MALDPLHGWNSQDRMVVMIGMGLAVTVLVDTVTLDHLATALHHLLHPMDLLMDRRRHITEDLLHLHTMEDPFHRHTTDHHLLHRLPLHVMRTTIISHMSTPLISTEEDHLEEMTASH